MTDMQAVIEQPEKAATRKNRRSRWVICAKATRSQMRYLSGELYLEHSWQLAFKAEALIFINEQVAADVLAAAKLLRPFWGKGLEIVKWHRWH